MAKGFTLLGTRARTTVSNYADSSVVGWPWGYLSLDSWGSCDGISSIISGEIIYIDCYLTTSGKTARIFVKASYKSGSTVYGYNLACFASDGTKIAGINLPSSNYNGLDFDDLFEVAFGDLPSITFANLSPTCQYTNNGSNNANIRGFYKNGSTAYNAGIAGGCPSNTMIFSTETPGTYNISLAAGGVSVNGTTYYNSNRGSYPYNKVGLFLSGGGGGGGGVAYKSGGGGGGGGGVILCVLDLSNYKYIINLGARGSGGAVKKGGGGGSTSILYYSEDGVTENYLMAYAFGGSGGSGGSTQGARWQGGAGGSYQIEENFSDYAELIAYASGGNGGQGGNNATAGGTAGGCSCSGSFVGNTSSSRVSGGAGGGTAAKQNGGAGGGSIGNGAGKSTGAGNAGSKGSGGSGGWGANTSGSAGGNGGNGALCLYY